MPTYCTEGEKAIITLTKNGKTFDLISNNSPITVECKNTDYGECTPCSVYVEQDTVGSGGKIISYAYRGVRSPVLGIRVDPNNNQQYQIYCRGGNGAACQPLGWYDFGNVSGTSYIYLNVSILSVTPSQQATANNKGVIIKDKNGAVIFDDNTIDCNWSVKCGGNCSDGYIECKCSQYPGYCCLPCEQTKADIKAITAIVRSINK